MPKKKKIKRRIKDGVFSKKHTVSFHFEQKMAE